MSPSISRRELSHRARSALYALAGLLVPGGVPFGMIDREHPAGDRPGTGA